MESIEKIIVDLETNIPIYAFILNFIIAFTLSFFGFNLSKYKLLSFQQRKIFD